MYKLLLIVACLSLQSCGLQPFPDEHISFDLDVQSRPKQTTVEELNLTTRP